MAVTIVGSCSFRTLWLCRWTVLIGSALYTTHLPPRLYASMRCTPHCARLLPRPRPAFRCYTACLPLPYAQPHYARRTLPCLPFCVTACRCLYGYAHLAVPHTARRLQHTRFNCTTLFACLFTYYPCPPHTCLRCTLTWRHYAAFTHTCLYTRMRRACCANTDAAGNFLLPFDRSAMTVFIRRWIRWPYAVRSRSA